MPRRSTRVPGLIARTAASSSSGVGDVTTGIVGVSARATRVRTVTDAPADPPTTRNRLLLLDGHSLAYRAFYALPVENFSTTTGQSTNAVYGFTSMLINLLRDEQPTHVAVAFDVSRESFRTERYAEYKAGRSKAPEAF